MSKILKKLSEEVIRVKFKRPEEGKFHRPTRIRKLTFEEIISDDGEGKKTNEVIVYKPLIPIGSPKELDPSTFITEWKKGEKPQHKRKDKNKGIQGKRRGGHKNKKSRNGTPEERNKRKQDHERIPIERASRRELKNKRALGKADSKKGTVAVEYTFTEKGGTEVRATKMFPSKGLLRNEDFKRFVKQFFEETTVIKFKRNRGDKIKERKKSEEVRLIKRAEKNAARKQRSLERRRKEYEELAEKAKNHSNIKGKTVGNMKPFITAMAPTEPKEIELVLPANNLKKAA